jgi:outer membrane protein OmpA-like peptidoglycan-associated protein
MAEQRSRRGVLIAAGAWIVIIVFGAVIWRFVVDPMRKGNLVEDTSAPTTYRAEVIAVADNYSGYGILRSDFMRNTLRTEGIKWTVRLDNANYLERLKLLEEGKIQFAPFTYAEYIKAGFKAGGEYPATQFLDIAASVGADKVIAWKQGVPDVQALNDPEARFVLTPDSPSQTMGEITVAQYALDAMSDDYIVPADGAQDVYNQFMRADRTLKRAYILWEPYASMALQDPGAHELWSSGSCDGCIADGLYASRKFVKDHSDIVKAVTAAHLRAVYHYTQEEDGFVQLVIADAKQIGIELDRLQAERIVAGVRWVNTQENYAAFGLVPTTGRTIEQRIEWMVDRVLMPVGALSQNPVVGKINTLYYPGTLQALQAENFHPAKRVDVIAGAGPATVETSRIAAVLPPLSDEAWRKLRTVGEKKVPAVEFRRGSSEISPFSQSDLDLLAQDLGVLASYYLRIRGNAMSGGNAEANQRLSKARADAVQAYLMAKGVSQDRLKAEAAPPGNPGGQAAVTFELLEQAY